MKRFRCKTAAVIGLASGEKHLSRLNVVPEFAYAWRRKPTARKMMSSYAQQSGGKKSRSTPKVYLFCHFCRVGG